MFYSSVLVISSLSDKEIVKEGKDIVPFQSKLGGYQEIRVKN